MNLKKLGKKAYPLFTQPQLDGVLTDQFVLDLDRELQSALWDKEFDTFEGAVNKARSMEYRRELLIVLPPKESLNVLNEPVKSDRQFSLINNREILNNTGDYFCSHCKRFGHLLNSCRILAEQRTRDFLRNNISNVVCYMCGIKGHRCVGGRFKIGLNYLQIYNQYYLPTFYLRV